MSSWQLIGVWLSFFFGVMIADQFVVESRFYILVLLVALVGAGLWRRGVGAFAAWLTLSLACLALLVGVVRMDYAEQRFVDSALATQVNERVELTGEVVREPDVRESFTQVYVQVDGELVLVRTSRFDAVQYGDVVTVAGKLTKPEVFETDTGRLFDYPSYLQARAVQYVVPFAVVEVESLPDGNGLSGWLYKVKDEFAAAIETMLPPPQSDLGLGLLLGIKQALGEDLEDAFLRTGLIHIVVLSGYNVMLVIAFFWWASSWFLPLRGRVVFSLVGIILFAVMVGLSATVVRASIMAGILLLAKFIGARYDVLRALLFAGLVMVLINPYLLLYDLGFQLSFMATLGLVLFLPFFESDLATDTRQVRLRDIFLATLVTQLFVLPLLIFHIGEVSLVAVAVNVLVLPIVAVAMGLTFITGLVALVSTSLAFPVAFLANLILSYIVTVVTWFDSLPWAAISLAPISVWQMLGLYGLLGLFWYVWQGRKNILHTPKAPDVLADWEIVEEVEDDMLDTSTKENSALDAPSLDPPIFFR